MAKDPAFLFYASDFMMGTAFFSDVQAGKYIRLLCFQHQHGGLIDKNSFNSIVGDDRLIRSKFVECDDGFYNERLAKEMEKRQKKSNNISEAAKNIWKERKKKNESDRIVIESYNNPNGKVIESHNDGNGIVIRPENTNENEINLDSNYQNMLIPKMVEIFKSSYPYYPVDENADYTACLSISYKIAKLKNWKKSTVLNENMQNVLDSWRKIVEFTTTDKWFSTRSISDFNTEFQRIVQSMGSGNKAVKQPTYEKNQPTAPPLTRL